jgi:hypothetical protein
LHLGVDLFFYPIIVAAILAPAAWFWRRHDAVEALALGALVSLAAWAALAFARFLVLLPPSAPRVAGILALAIALAGIYLITRSATPAAPAEPRRPSPSSLLPLLAGAALLALGVEAVVPHYGIANLYYDWWEHFDLARFYRAPSDLLRIYQDGYTVTSRTPLYNLVTSLPLTLFGERFSVFQVATAALAWLWVMPALLLARRFVADQGTRLVALLALSPLILIATTYPWPKGLVTFFTLLALDRFFALRQAGRGEGRAVALQMGLASGLTLMTHEGFAGYLLPLYALLVFEVIAKRGPWVPLATACASGLLVALPWYAWAVAQYGVRGGLIGYPEPGYAGVGAWLLDHVVILVSSAVPITVLFHALGGNPVQQVFVAYLRTAVGLLGVAFLLRVLARSVRPAPADLGGLRPLIGFAVAGIVSTTLLLNGWGNGWASAESVFIPAMVALVIVALTRAPLTQGMVAVAIAECLVVLASAVTFLWSPASSGEPNAQLAVATQLRFLGRDAWPLGVPLMLIGAASLLYALSGARLAAHKKEPRAGWHEAPLVL